jgi:hypothetical protein
MANPAEDFTQPESAVQPDIPGAVAATEAAVQDHSPASAAKAFTADAPIVSTLVQDVPLAINETRRGWKTSEFWGVLVAAFTTVGPIDVTDKNKLIVGVLAIGYALARGLAKAGVPNASPVEPTDGP